MTLVHPLQLQQLQLFWEGFLQGLGVCLCENLTILPEGHLQGHILMLDGQGLALSLRSNSLVHSHVGTGRGHPQSVPTMLGAWNCPTSLGMSSKGTEKQPHTIIPPPSNSPGNCQTQTRPSICQMEKRDLSLQRTRLHCSRPQWWSALHHCI